MRKKATQPFSFFGTRERQRKVGIGTRECLRRSCSFVWNKIENTELPVSMKKPLQTHAFVSSCSELRLQKWLKVSRPFLPDSRIHSSLASFHPVVFSSVFGHPKCRRFLLACCDEVSSCLRFTFCSFPSFLFYESMLLGSSHLPAFGSCRTYASHVGCKCEMCRPCSADVFEANTF